MQPRYAHTYSVDTVYRFQLKFQKIVQDEQEDNFISRLHAGELAIIPWPVIESSQFYSLFRTLRRLLDRQQVTHRTAGVFLHTLKILMAKLKVCQCYIVSCWLIYLRTSHTKQASDWGALDRKSIFTGASAQPPH